MLYQIHDGTVSVGGRRILFHIDFFIKGNEKIAVVGKNGAGKTTLLRLIAGELELDRDDKRQGPGILTSRKITVGLLHQQAGKDQDKTVEELLMEGCPAGENFSRERFAWEQEYDRLFTGFGFDKKEKGRKLSSFSGGEQTRLRLIRLLLEKPDILLLDEPTNHLDIPTVEWLERYMRSYDRAVVFVSHDRFFLDQVVDVVYELQGGKLKRYSGNYTRYRVQKQKDLALAKKAYDRQQEELQRLNELIERFKHKPRKAAFARSRKKLIERMERAPKPEEDDVHIFTGSIDPLVPGSKWMLEVEHLKIGYEKELLELSLRVKRGQKIGVIGDNGAGKTTFLKTAAGLLAPLEGKCTLGNRAVVGYFDQQSADLQSEKTVAAHFHDLFPGLTEKEVRRILGAYLFSGRAAQTCVSGLSGGEKARLVLAELLQSRPNFLLLDEPTNHMDIQAKETLESAFRAYTGTILFVSHDRYFIRQVADAILVFQGNAAYYYPFGYEHYLEKIRKESGGVSAMVQAEDQALLAGLQAVPKKAHMQSRPLSTQEAWLDWRMGLLRQEAVKAGEQTEQIRDRLREKQEELRQFSWAVYIQELYPVETALPFAGEQAAGTGALSLSREEEKESRDAVWRITPQERLASLQREYEALLRELQDAEESWTRSCMELWETCEE